MDSVVELWIANPVTVVSALDHQSNYPGSISSTDSQLVLNLEIDFQLSFCSLSLNWKGINDADISVGFDPIRGDRLGSALF